MTIEIDMGNRIILHENVEYSATRLPDFLQDILVTAGWSDIVKRLMRYEKEIGLKILKVS